MLQQRPIRLKPFEQNALVHWLQWPLIGIVGVLLGVYVVVTGRLSSQWQPLLIALAFISFLVMASGKLKWVLLSVILFDLPLQIDIALNSHGSLENTGAINGFIISVTTCCLLALYVDWAIELLFTGKTGSRHVIRPNVALLTYLLIVAASIAVAAFKMLAAFEIFLLLQIFLMYFYLINNIRTRGEITLVVVILLIGLLIESLMIVWIQVAGEGFSFAGISGQVYSKSTSSRFSRIGGSLVSANVAGSYLSLLTITAFGCFLLLRQKAIRWLALPAFVCGAVALISTGSRGAWLSTFIAFLIFLFFIAKKKWVAPGKLFSALAIGSVIAILFSVPIYLRIFSYDFGSAASRIPQFQIALEIIKDHPILGIGTNNYPAVQQSYLGIRTGLDVFIWSVHNKYLLVWAETGIFGLIAFLVFLCQTVRQGFNVANRNDALFSPVALAFTAGIIGQMVHMFFDVFHSRAQIQLLWFVAGAITVMELLLSQENGARYRYVRR